MKGDWYDGRKWLSLRFADEERVGDEWERAG
jgi:hypothetical protein